MGNILKKIHNSPKARLDELDDKSLLTIISYILGSYCAEEYLANPTYSIFDDESYKDFFEKIYGLRANKKLKQQIDRIFPLKQGIKTTENTKLCGFFTHVKDELNVNHQLVNDKSIRLVINLLLKYQTIKNSPYKLELFKNLLIDCKNKIPLSKTETDKKIKNLISLHKRILKSFPWVICIMAMIIMLLASGLIFAKEKYDGKELLSSLFTAFVLGGIAAFLANIPFCAFYFVYGVLGSYCLYSVLNKENFLSKSSERTFAVHVNLRFLAMSYMDEDKQDLCLNYLHEILALDNTEQLWQLKKLLLNNDEMNSLSDLIWKIESENNLSQFRGVRVEPIQFTEHSRLLPYQ